MIRIEADAIQSTEHEMLSAPIRLITNQSKIRVTLKRRVRNTHMEHMSRNTHLLFDGPGSKSTPLSDSFLFAVLVPPHRLQGRQHCFIKEPMFFV